MFPTSPRRSLREFAAALPPSDAVRAALEAYERTGNYEPDDLRKILGDPAGSVEFGPGVVHKRLMLSEARHGDAPAPAGTD